MNMDFEEPHFNRHCSNFTLWDWRSLNIVRGVAATFGGVIILAILLFLLYHKAYSSLFQRLYLYLIVATFLNELTGIVNLEHQFSYKDQDKVCVWVGFFLAWTYVLVFIFSYEIIFYLLYLVISRIFHVSLPIRCNRGTRCLAMFAEVVYICLPVIVATAFSLPPLVQKPTLYGIAGPWCFVRSLTNDDSCTPVGKASQIVFYSMYTIVGLTGVFAAIIFSGVYVKIANSFTEARQLLRKTLYLLIFKCVHILMIMVSFACRLNTLYTGQHKPYILWLAHALSVPIGVLVFPLGYLLCFDSQFRKIAMAAYYKLASRCCKCEHNDSSLRQHPHARNATIQEASAPISDRVSQRSTTYYTVLHPDESMVSHPDESSETTPLLGSTHL